MSESSCRVFAHQPPRWFDLEHLRDVALPVQIEFFQTIGSTNDYALEVAALEATSCPLLVLAEEQTGGRGRGSNRWWAKHGSLTFSLLIEPLQFGVRPEQWPLVSLATAIAMSDVIGHCAGSNPVGLKWPNDLHLNHKKVCGILVETVKQRSDRMVIGIGLNVRNSFSDAPSELRDIATSLVDETGSDWDLTLVLDHVLRALFDRLNELGSNRLPLQEVWARHCVLTGRQVSLDVGDRRIAGLCRGINEHGALVLETDGVIQAWFGGVVRISETSTARCS